MKRFLLLTISCFLLLSVAARAQNIIYVNAAAAGNNDGSSWANAFTYFQSGIAAASPGDSVFVAGGTYKLAWDQYFAMKGGVNI